MRLLRKTIACPAAQSPIHSSKTKNYTTPPIKKNKLKNHRSALDALLFTRGRLRNEQGGPGWLSPRAHFFLLELVSYLRVTANRRGGGRVDLRHLCSSLPLPPSPLTLPSRSCLGLLSSDPSRSDAHRERRTLLFLLLERTILSRHKSQRKPQLYTKITEHLRLL